MRLKYLFQRKKELASQRGAPCSLLTLALRRRQLPEEACHPGVLAHLVLLSQDLQLLFQVEQPPL